MKPITFFASIALSVATFFALPAAAQGNILTGDTRLACEAIMCLATSQRPHECNPSLRRYFSIVGKKPGDTIRDRIAFLNGCPAGNQTPEMQSFVTAMAQGAGQCDAASLNQTPRFSLINGNTGFISNVLPPQCAAYLNHAYTGGTVAIPRYVGVPERGGFWAEPANYEQALAQYNARIQKEDQEKLLNADLDNGMLNMRRP